jgi:signal peptidase I
MKLLLLAEDAVFVMGDNRDHSNDSRFFGPISRNKVVGRALYVLDSEDPSRIGVRLAPTPEP